MGHAAMTTIRLQERGKFGDDPASPIGHHILATLIDTRIAGCTVADCKTCTRKDFSRTFDFFDATGPDFYGSALDVLQEGKVISSAGGWYAFGDTKFRRDDFEEQLEKNPAILEALAEILKGGHPSD